MASVQCEMKDVQLTLEEKACLDEMIKQAERSLESHELLAGALKNQTVGPLSIVATKIFAGQVVRNFPNPLCNLDGFAMSGKYVTGVKAAVVYSAKNKNGVECGWLLAFSDTNNAVGGRVFAECGLKGKFRNINWAQVEQKLEKSGTIAKAYDLETGTSLYASICGPTGKSAAGAVFLG
ncbi:jasmonate-induced protein homolog [Lolium rigidum]|uniref:jasmonate-induced protein homolog n=1 Tax=Lolium rigidum TaxID=89674 RepID=UPI001F5D2BC4|nr:jasmonate-induced protein homolog [Lolium rigidum]XP_047060569.1 jasmonate-induced protein homolog [Lolium rigidum]